jgi:outer membrane lipoprotein carrier protein
MKLSLALILAIAFSAPEQSSSGIAPLLRKFEGTYRSSKTLRATFLQKYFDNGKLVRSEAGVAYFGKPGKMRWEYESPEANLYIVDGKWSWFYVPADHTVTRVRAKQSADTRTPFALLAGEMKVSRFCKSVAAEKSVRPSDPDSVVLKCSLLTTGAADAPSGSYVLFELRESTGELRRVVVADPGGVQVEFQFANWEYNPRVADATFRFSPPPGVAIVDGDPGTAPEGQRDRPAATPGPLGRQGAPP